MRGIRSWRARLALAGVTTTIALAAGAAAASAQTITVSGAGDASGSSWTSCSSAPVSCPTLRTAIAYVNQDSQADTIVLDTHPTYTITSGNGELELDSSFPVTITGQGAASTTITQTSDTSTLLKVENGSAAISGVTFEGGDAPASGESGGQGGAIDNEATLSLTDDDFTDNNAIGGNASGTDGGYSSEGGAIYNNGILSVTGCAFSGNQARGGGGGSEYGGSGGNGGAISNDGPATITSSSFDGNEATAGTGASASDGEGGGGNGGAIYNSYSTLVVQDSTFGATSANRALNSAIVTSGPNSWGGEGGQGGAIFDYEGDDTLGSDAFDANAADGAPSGNQGGGGGGSGGAIDVEESDITINGGSFTGNTASAGGTSSGNTEPGGGDGGAIGGGNSIIDISGATFTSNTANGGGAGTVESGYGGEGGAIALYGGQLTLSSTTFTSNQALNGTGVSGGYNYESSAYGGALYLQTNAQVTGSTFTSNSATASSVSGAPGADGGAVALQDGADGSFTDSTFTTNSVAAGGTAGSPNGGEGGAIDNEYGAVVTATADTFTGNTAPNGSGGALYAGSPLWLSASTLTGNSAEDGGGLYGNTSLVSVVNSTLDGNTAEATPAGDGEGGGIDGDISTLRLASDTIVANAAYGNDSGGNVSVYGNVLAIHDTIIANGSLLGGGSSGEANCSIDVEEFDDQGYNAEDNQSDGNECGFDATGDLVDSTSLDASLGSLASNGGPTQTVALLAGSPAIDAGDPAGCTDPLGNVLTSDQRGVARPQEARCDIGAYEYVPPPAAPLAASTPTPVAPALSELALSPGVFLSVSGGGSTITYDDSEAGLTSFTVTGKVAGYKHGKHGCKELPKSGKRPKHSQPCTLTLTADSFTHQDVAGSNDVLFPGEPNGHKLPSGTYTLSAKPTLDGLTGATATTTFKIAG
ncbi:MAG: choice-of-anchor Q domain-containing protein [Solirubrobacteraceae bacterium]|jgi:hypothetical protein